MTEGEGTKMIVGGLAVIVFITALLWLLSVVGWWAWLLWTIMIGAPTIVGMSTNTRSARVIVSSITSSGSSVV
jgi:hypothetical protein